MHKTCLSLLLIAVSSSQIAAQSPAHARTQFQFSIDLPYAEAFPLFGAWGEQKWSRDWKPAFVYPNPPADREGAVFRIDRGPSHASIWTLTRFDIAAGRVQYVYILNQLVVTKIDIVAASKGAAATDVTVAYERTALDSKANAHVEELARQDAQAGPEWREAINQYAKKRVVPSSMHRQD